MQPTYETIVVHASENDIVTIHMNRPDIGNALNAQMIADLTDIFHQLATTEQRLIILRGSGKHFCAGADLNWMKASVSLGYTENLADAQKLGNMLRCLYDLPTPTLAIIQGAAFAGGMGLVACCDMAIGTPRAQFCLSEVNIGLVPAMISPFVAQAIGNRYAQYLALTGIKMSAETAWQKGLLTEIVEESLLEETITSFGQQFIQCAPIAQKSCKALFRQVGDGDLSSDIAQYTQELIASTRVSPEGQEGLKSFIEKRPPAWRRPASPTA